MKSLQSLVLASIFVGSFGASSISAATFRRPASVSFFILNSVDKPQDNNFAELIKAGFALYQQKKFDEALADFTKAAALSPKDFRPHALSGVVYMAQWKLKSASEEFAQAIELKPDEKRLYLSKARADQLRGAKEEALAACRKALEIDPSFAEAEVMIGDILKFDEKRRGEAIVAYRSALKINPHLLEAYNSLAQLLAEIKDDTGAEELFRQAMAQDPQHMIGRFTLGRFLVKQGRLTEARSLWEGRTSDEDKTFPNFITLLERAEKMKQATDSLALKPHDPETIVQMGLAMMDGDSWVVDGRQERAIVYFRKALELKPDLAKAQYAIVKADIQIADTYKEKKKNVDDELAKLRQLDPKLADEMEEYRKNYSGGIKVAPAILNQ